ncbi:Tyrosine decarboxylase 1 [Abeliophyllum distichum]|uniref:Tyrosine decarboxylase 1 n=1 Tax=Abeliophyllum distichum TaxID=126358 RepID=A0ABD1PTF8_9LAMI
MSSLHNQNLENGFTRTTIEPLDPEEFRRQGHMVIDFLADYYKNVEKYPVRSQVQSGYLRERLPESAPHDPEPIEEILQDVQKDIVDNTLVESKLFCLFSIEWKHCWISWRNA